MSTSAIRTSFIYLVVSVFCAVFGGIYEMFSHEVYSFYMIYAFLFPLTGGSLVFSLLHFLQIKRYPDAGTKQLYHSGIATWTVGSVVKGVLEIYGTTNALSDWYMVVGTALVLAAIVCYLKSCIANLGRKGYN